IYDRNRRNQREKQNQTRDPEKGPNRPADETKDAAKQPRAFVRRQCDHSAMSFGDEPGTCFDFGRERKGLRNDDPVATFSPFVRGNVEVDHFQRLRPNRRRRQEFGKWALTGRHRRFLSSSYSIGHTCVSSIPETSSRFFE